MVARRAELSERLPGRRGNPADRVRHRWDDGSVRHGDGPPPPRRFHGARRLSECRVVRLEEEGRSVKRAICDWHGRPIEIKGKIFVLAANAFLTPAILGRSVSDRFPEGLANSSGLVGRNLMLHVSDI